MGLISQVTGIEFLSKTQTTYSNELNSFANKGLKLNTKEDGNNTNQLFN
jgi:hypothetical protein